MYEVEIKVPADLETVRSRLREGGADPGAVRRQRDVYYDAPHREFAETDEALRIRRETTDDREATTDDREATTDDRGATTDDASDAGESVRLTYKGPLVDDGSKTRSEHETGVEDGEELAGVLDGLGFEPAATVEKRREYWRFEGFTVALDSVDRVGEFVEIERAVDAEDAIDPTREAAIETLRTLGIDADDQVRTSYLGLLLAEE
ncbi:class IV adenylate cyclase [Halorubrum sp. 48-1-W]|uniref:class IV adenylate cyclase n=1 Tax=Halorubrum sp. 48-1-W TaxID=2249761 RepID=UPI000DCD8E1D|nr:class IV adenylate cyclase [Halorubrum sp. 48-1-W]RAW44850.1 class IV adenylate cyclase [Halorubrum sp. 48-1-W]